MDNGKRTFAMAEAECMMDSEAWPYRKQLFYSMNNNDLDYMAHAVLDRDDDRLWIGIDERDLDTVWETRFG